MIGVFSLVGWSVKPFGSARSSLAIVVMTDSSSDSSSSSPSMLHTELMLEALSDGNGTIHCWLQVFLMSFKLNQDSRFEHYIILCDMLVQIVPSSLPAVVGLDDCEERSSLLALLLQESLRCWMFLVALRFHFSRSRASVDFLRWVEVETVSCS